MEDPAIMYKFKSFASLNMFLLGWLQHNHCNSWRTLGLQGVCCGVARSTYSVNSIQSKDIDLPISKLEKIQNLPRSTIIDFKTSYIFTIF